MLEGSSSSPDHGEEILADVAANFFWGIEVVGGRLKITSRRVLFEASEINLQEQPAEILSNDITEVSKRNTMGIIPNGLLIRTKGDVNYKFVVWRRGKLIELINSRLWKKWQQWFYFDVLNQNWFDIISADSFLYPFYVNPPPVPPSKINYLSAQLSLITTSTSIGSFFSRKNLCKLTNYWPWLD
jgi:hypothetical protein